MPYWRLHYHLVWATYKRLPLLAEPVEQRVYGAILQKAKEIGVTIHAIGNVEDHIHIAGSIPPKIAVADCVRQLKGASSHYANAQPDAENHFSWQEGYGALTFGERAMEDVIAYVRNQKEHHKKKTTRAPFERMTDEDNGVEISR